MDDIRETSGIDSTTQMDGDFGTDFEAGLMDGGLENQQPTGQDTGEGGADGLGNQQPEGQQEQPEDKQEGGQEPPAEARQEQQPQLVPMIFNGQQIMLPQEAVQQLRGALGTDPVSLLQKGMNYDHKAERELRVLDQYAEASGMTRAQYLAQLEQAQQQAELNAEIEKARGEFPEGTPDAALQEIAKSRVASKRAAEQQQRAQQQAAVQQVFDALPTLVIQKLNSLIDQLQQQAAAGQIGVTPFDGMTAQTLQAALEQIQADIGGNYGGADGAGKVGYTPSEGVDEDTVQAAIEAVQANLAAYIAKIKAATGAAEVGNAPIAGMTATNVQQALEELRENIDNIVSGIIPGGSITNDMLQGPVSVEKGGTGATTPQGALANLGAGVRPNELDNPGLCVNQRGQESYTGNGGEPVTFDRWQAGLNTTIAQNGGNIVVSASGGAGYILQSLENPILGKAIVFSVLITSGLYECKGVVNSGGSITQATPFGAISVTHGARMYALIRLNDGQSITLPVQDGDVAKLEIGDTQTLAYQDDDGAWQLLPQPESDYATQLSKCQRYLMDITPNIVFNPAYFGQTGEGEAVFLVPTPVTMRIAPSVICNPDKIQIALNNGTFPVPTAVSVLQHTQGGVIIRCTVDMSGIAAFSPCDFRSSDITSKILLSAEL